MIATSTKTVELVLASELSKEAFDKARLNWVMESEAPWETMEQAWHEVSGVIQFINENLGEVLTIENVHGAGTEQVFTSNTADIYTSWGTLQEFGDIDTNEAWKYADDCWLSEEVASLWNEKAPTMSFLYQRMNRTSENERRYDLHEVAYRATFEAAINAMADRLNNYIFESDTYSTSLEAFQEHIWTNDDELWFKTDGTLYAIRGASYFYAVDTYEDLIPVEEFGAFRMIATTC